MDKSKRIVFTIVGAIGTIMYFKRDIHKFHHVYIEGGKPE